MLDEDGQQVNYGDQLTCTVAQFPLSYCPSSGIVVALYPMLVTIEEQSDRFYKVLFF